MDTPLISVIVTTYKRPFSVVSRAIDSALSQTHTNFEIIVIDDSPQSEDRDRLKVELEGRYGDSITYLQNEVNMGACASRNRGFALSKGQYVAFLDDDDEWLPQKNELMLQCFDSDNVGLVYCRLLPLKNGKPIKRTRQKKLEGSVLPHLLVSNFIGGCSVPLFRRDVVEQAGLFDVSFPASQDIDLYIRVAQLSSVRYLDVPLVKYFMTKDSITGSQKRQMAGRMKLLEKHDGLYDQYPDARHKYAITIVSGFLAMGQRDVAWDLFKKEYGISPASLLRYSPYLVKGYLKRLVRWTS